MSKYLVWQKYFDDGRVTAGIKRITEEEANNLEKSDCTKEYDLYNDIFDGLPEAKKFYRKALSI